MKIVYLDCFSGISGDMTLAALVDAGADRGYIEQELAKIQIEPFSLSWKRTNKRGISALKLDVLLDPAQAPAHHRHYAEIVELIGRAGFNERTTALALAIFAKIGIAEAKIHDIPVEKVHFHEVGAMDSIVDVVGIALAIDSLEVEKVVCSPVPLGSGTVKCDHGIYPVPAPATLEMLRGLPVAPSRHAVELTTPTGAGIVSGIADEFNTGIPAMIVESIGYGAGTRDLPDQPNVLRAVVGRSDPHLSKWYVSHELLRHADHQHEQVHHRHHHEHGHGHIHVHTHRHLRNRGQGNGHDCAHAAEHERKHGDSAEAGGHNFGLACARGKRNDHAHSHVHDVHNVHDHEHEYGHEQTGGHGAIPQPKH